MPVSFGAGVGAALALSLTRWLRSASGDGQDADPAPEPSGWVTMRPVEAPRLCVTEGRERDRRTERQLTAPRGYVGLTGARRARPSRLSPPRAGRCRA
ncbi:hypothetical protein AB0F42_01770 [Streptomyces buecherae]|uniref:hypothetical protein n=1 Tax=Streptomyces buecherae TaxID=2763006 RepID=UPI0033F02A80